MHHTMIFLIKSDSEKEALENAKEQLNNLIEHNIGCIDSGSFIDEKRVIKHNKKAALNLDSVEGKMWLLRCMHATYRDFLESIEKVEYLLRKNSKEEIFKNGFMLYSFFRVYEKEWICIDNNLVALDSVNGFLKGKSLDTLWVVPCDVHT
jgi:hypothetical protein